MDEHAEERRFAGRMSEEYELLHLAYPDYEAFQQRVADGVAGREAEGQPDGPPVRVLEIGCGTGSTTRAILERTRRARVLALDNEPEMIRKAHEELARWIDDGRLELLRAEALTRLRETPAGSFDAVAGAFTLHNFEAPVREELLRECFRVLSSGGLFVNADKYAPEESERYAALILQVGRFFDAFVPLGKPDLLREWVLHNIADQAPERVMPERETVRAMEAMGFRNIRVSDRSAMQALLIARKPGAAGGST